MSLAVLSFAACQTKSDSEWPGKSAEEVPLIKRGKAVYQAACTACHHSNPKLDGALGPAVAGSSLELLEARILRAEYPAGYTPKRSTHQMVALPQYQSDIPALHQYLQAVK